MVRRNLAGDVRRHPILQGMADCGESKWKQQMRRGTKTKETWQLGVMGLARKRNLSRLWYWAAIGLILSLNLCLHLVD